MLTLVYMDLLDKIKNLSKKQKAYFGAFMAIVALLAWAFISAGVITHNFNRSQLQTDQDRQEASIDGIILTETKDEKTIFDDINGVAWAKKEIEYLAEKGILNGKSDRHFNPNDNITREEFVEAVKSIDTGEEK